MTEEDAENKWCPFVRLTTIGHASRPLPSMNRLVRISEKAPAGEVEFPVATTCIGSQCMAWRSGTRSAVRHRTTGVVRYLSPGDIYSSLDEVHFTAPDNSNGYCGLAGKPDQ